MRECMAESTDLTAEEIRHLETLPHAAHMVKSPLECELEDGHAGPHYALAQSDDRGADDATHWWLRWSEGSREWTHEACCYVENDDASELCLLPEGHQGCHGWA